MARPRPRPCGGGCCGLASRRRFGVHRPLSAIGTIGGLRGATPSGRGGGARDRWGAPGGRMTLAPAQEPDLDDRSCFRSRMGLLLLRDRGDITDNYEVECLLAETKAQQAAAILLPNTEHAPVHIADVIIAIGRLRKAKMDTAAIARSLGYAELEIKRLEALAAVDPLVLKALRQGKLTLKQVRLFARLPDKAQQKEIAQTALDGYFHDYQLRAVVENGRATVDDERFVLVGRERYISAGGRISSDLFGELPDALLDPDILQARSE